MVYEKCLQSSAFSFRYTCGGISTSLKLIKTNKLCGMVTYKK